MTASVIRSMLAPVRLRDPDEAHRTATPLELFFDLCFVVAVAALAAELHHAIADDHALSGALNYALLFIPLWWAWMSFTWHATAYDNDDALWRVLTLLQMGGVLAFAAATPSAVHGEYWPITLAYTAMRVPLIVSWLRAAHRDRVHAVFARRYAIGISAALLTWIAAASAPEPLRWGLWALAVTLELATPPWAVAAASARIFHAGHIAERYGLFTIIVLGECVLAVSVALREALDVGALDATVVAVSGSALVAAGVLWWLYFDALGREGLERNRRAAFVWGYGHYVVFAAVAAIGAGVQAQVDLLGESSEQSVSAAAVGLPVVLTLVALAWLQHAANARASAAGPLLGAAVAVATVTVASVWLPVGFTDMLLACVLGAALVRELVRP